MSAELPVAVRAAELARIRVVVSGITRCALVGFSLDSLYVNVVNEHFSGVGAGGDEFKGELEQVAGIGNVRLLKRGWKSASDFCVVYVYKGVGAIG